MHFNSANILLALVAACQAHDLVSLKLLVEPGIIEDKVIRYLDQSAVFASNDVVQKELAEWKSHNNDFPYTQLKGLMIPALIDKPFIKPVPYQAADTFFSEFSLHNPSEMILSESTDSYIIGNKASHDFRQYPEYLNERWVPGSTPESMTFGHFLVIPKQRVYNIVDPDATIDNLKLIREMKSHWELFVSSSRNKLALVERFRLAMYDQYKACKQLAGSDVDKKSKVEQDFNNVEASFEKFSEAFLKLSADEFIAGFHVAPDHSVGHLHMHVLPTPVHFREFSTMEHDEKTIPFEAIEIAES